MQTICNGKINNAGRCEKCYQVSQTTSGYCTRLVDVLIDDKPESDGAEEYFAERNGGKTALQMTVDKEYITPVWATILMHDFARQRIIAYDKWLLKNHWGDSRILTPEQSVDEFLVGR